MASDDSNTNCELKDSVASNHNELISSLKDIQAGVRECKETKDKTREVEEQRRLATEAHQEKKIQADLAFAEKLREIMELRDARRRESMRATNTEPGAYLCYSPLFSLKT